MQQLEKKTVAKQDFTRNLGRQNMILHVGIWPVSTFMRLRDTEGFFMPTVWQDLGFTLHRNQDLQHHCAPYPKAGTVKDAIYLIIATRSCSSFTLSAEEKKQDHRLKQDTTEHENKIQEEEEVK